MVRQGSSSSTCACPQKIPFRCFVCIYLFVSFCIYLFTRCDPKIPYWANVLSPAAEAFLVQAHFPVPWCPFCESQMRISSYLVTGIEFQCTAWRKIIGKKQTWVACHLVLCEHFGSYPSIPDISWHNLIWSDLLIVMMMMRRRRTTTMMTTIYDYLWRSRMIYDDMTWHDMTWHDMIW